jgi:protein O-GlcNAc transferase
MIGSGETSGLRSVDVLISDRWLSGAVSGYVGERHVLDLPGGMLSFSAEGMPTRPSKPRRSAGIVFGAFHKRSKISSEAIDLWATALRAVPGSHLLIKSPEEVDVDFADIVLDMFERRGVDRSKVRFLGFVEAHDGHLALLDEVDILLDAAPFNGLTTTLEALWMGVPLVSAPGPRRISRFGASILNHADLGQFCAPDFSEFGATARRIATDRDLLSRFRSGCRDHLAMTPTFNLELYARSFASGFNHLLAMAASGAGVRRTD